MVIQEPIYRGHSLFLGGVTLLLLGWLGAPLQAQTPVTTQRNTRQATSTPLRPVMRKHTVATYYERNWFRRVEQASGNLSQETIATLYSRSRFHIVRGKDASSAISTSHLPVGGGTTIAKRPILLSSRQREKAKRVAAKEKPGTEEKASPQTDATVGGGEAIKTGLPEGILPPIESP